MYEDGRHKPEAAGQDRQAGKSGIRGKQTGIGSNVIRVQSLCSSAAGLGSEGCSDPLTDSDKVVTVRKGLGGFVAGS